MKKVVTLPFWQSAKVEDYKPRWKRDRREIRVCRPGDILTKWQRDLETGRWLYECMICMLCPKSWHRHFVIRKCNSDLEPEIPLK